MTSSPEQNVQSALLTRRTFVAKGGDTDFGAVIDFLYSKLNSTIDNTYAAAQGRVTIR